MPELLNRIILKLKVMKKFYFLSVIALLFMFTSAIAQRVSLRIPSSYEVSIDDRFYGNHETVEFISNGQHTVKLYEVKPGLFGVGKRRVLKATSYFEVRNNNVTIETDQYGQLRIYEPGYSNNKNSDRNNRRRNDYPANDDYGCRKDNGRGYGHDNSRGRGNKYGWYKKHHHKHRKYENDDRDERRDRDDDDRDN